MSVIVSVGRLSLFTRCYKTDTFIGTKTTTFYGITSSPTGARYSCCKTNFSDYARCISVPRLNSNI